MRLQTASLIARSVPNLEHAQVMTRMLNIAIRFDNLLVSTSEEPHMLPDNI